MSGITARTRETVLERDQHSCVSCGINISAAAIGYSVHHRIPRGMGGTRNPEVNMPANLLVLCGSGTTGCHGWVESHRVLAREWGYLVHRHQAPEHVAVMTPTGWVMFDHQGGRTPVEPGPNSADPTVDLARDVERALDIRTGRTPA